MLDAYKPGALVNNQTQTPTISQPSTRVQIPASNDSVLGGFNLFRKPEEEQIEEPQNKNSSLGIIGRSLATMPSSIGKGLTNQLDKISDTPANVRNVVAQKDAELGDFASRAHARIKETEANKAAFTHLLGKDVKDWEKRVDERQQAILDDNPNSKLAKAGVFANELGESVGAMLPTIAASAVTGGLMSAASGGSAALGARAALGSKSALDTIGTIKKVSEAAGLGTMFMGVYSNSLEEAVNNGADYQTASKKALLDGLLEVGTEKMFAGIAGMGTGAFAERARKVVNSAGADDAVKMLGVKKAGLALANMIDSVTKLSEKSAVSELLFDALGEATEEMVSEFFSPYIERATTNKYAENATLEEILRAGLGGALISFAMNPVGKITGRLTDPSEQQMAQARMDFRTSDPDQIIANMATLSFQEITSKEDINAIEKIIGRKLAITPVMDAGEEVGYYADGLTNRARRRQAVEAIQAAIDAGKTGSAIQTLRERMSSIWDEEVAERQDIAGAQAFANKVSEERLKTDKKYQNLVKRVEEYETKYRDAKSKLDELDLAAKAEDATEETKKAYEAARTEFNRIKNELSKADARRENERDRMRHDIDYNITEAKFREEFGDEFMDSFFAAQRVREARAGQAYLEGSDGLKRVYNKYEYARDKYGKEYSRNKKIRDKVDRDFKRFDDEITAEIASFKDQVNEALASRGIAADKLRVEVSTDPVGDAAYYQNGVITFDATQLSSAMGAQFLMSHELLHAIDDRFMTNEQFDALGKAIENSMKALNFDANNTFIAMASVYDAKYRADCIREAEKKGIPKDKVLDYAEELLQRRIKEETYARFMSVAFGSESILQSLAMVNPALLESMLASVEKSSLANLPNSMWGYTRWQVLDRINRALAAPIDPEDLKEDLEIDKEMAFTRLSGNFKERWGPAVEGQTEFETDEFYDYYNSEPKGRYIDPVTGEEKDRSAGAYYVEPADGMYSRIQQSINKMSLNDFKSVFNSDEAFVNALIKMGVKKEEIEYSFLLEDLKELRKDVKAKRVSIDVAKDALADMSSDSFGVLIGQTKLRSSYPNSFDRGAGAYSRFQFDPDSASGYKAETFSMPENRYNSPHWGGRKGVVTHLRSNIRKTLDGDPVYFVEENQSDLHSTAQRKSKQDKTRTALYASEKKTAEEEVNKKIADARSKQEAGINAVRNKLSANKSVLKDFLLQSPEYLMEPLGDFNGVKDRLSGEIYITRMHPVFGELGILSPEHLSLLEASENAGLGWDDFTEEEQSFLKDYDDALNRMYESMPEEDWDELPVSTMLYEYDPVKYAEYKDSPKKSYDAFEEAFESLLEEIPGTPDEDLIDALANADSKLVNLFADAVPPNYVLERPEFREIGDALRDLERFHSEVLYPIRAESERVLSLPTIDDAPYKKDRASLYTMQRALASAVAQDMKYIAWTPAWIQNIRWDDGFNYDEIYNKRIPKDFGKYAEKLGGKLTKIRIEYNGDPTYGLYPLEESAYQDYKNYVDENGYIQNMRSYNTWRDIVLDKNQRQFIEDLRGLSEDPNTAFYHPEEIGNLANALYEKYPERYDRESFKKIHEGLGDGKNGVEVQAIEITPELKKNIEENGQPRFAFARLSDQHNPNAIDHMYARSAEALSVMSDNAFRSAIAQPNTFLRKYLRKYGVKDEEIKQTGLIPEAQELWGLIKSGEITDSEARQRLIKRAETEGILEEVIQGNSKTEKSVWDTNEYTLPGDHDRYGDYLYTLPANHAGAMFSSGHFDEPGILVHIRADRRYTMNRQPVFFVEEVQSDYHNKAHRKDEETGEPIGSYQDDIAARLEDLDERMNASGLSDEEFKTLQKEYEALLNAVPHAPFEDDFGERYAMKRALLHAIEDGAEYLAWTTPEMQEKRWSKKSAKAYRNTYGLRIKGFMDRYARQWGSGVEKLSLDASRNGVNPSSIPRDDSLMAKIMPVDKYASPQGTYEVYGIKITPQMRKDILENGQSRWNFTRLGGEDIELDEQRAQEYQALMEKYGAYDNGSLRKISQHVGVSRTVDQMFGSKNIGSKTLNTRLINAVLEGEEGLTHIIMTDDAAKMDALKRIRSHQTIAEAYTEATNALSGNRVPDKNDLVFGEQLLVDMAKQLQNIESGQDVRANESKDPTQLLDQMQHLIADLCAAGTRAGQNLQAFRLLKKLTPTGRLYYIEAQAKAYLSEMVDRKGLSRVGGYRYARDKKGNVIIDERTGKPKEALKISDELRRKMEACKTQAEMDAVEAEIIDEIAAQIPPTLTDRIVAWRYLAMLGNPRTHIRNMVSNYAMGVAVKAKNRVGGVLEDIFLKDRDVVGRTKTNRKIDPTLRESLEKFADKDWLQDNVNEYALSGGKVGFQSRIDERRNKLGFGGFNFFDNASKKNSEWLEKEDDWAARRAYRNAFVSYCAANNLTPAKLSAGTVESNTRLAQARSYAVNEAAKATYHDANALATHLNQMEKMNGASKIIIGGLVPFKKTPANILKRGIEYSPISIVNGIKEFRKASGLDTEAFIAERMGAFEAAAGRDKLTNDSPYYSSGAEAAKDIGKVNGVSKADLRYSAEATKTKLMADALDKLASGLTGAMIMMLGMLLGHAGLMKGAGDENDREEYYDQMLGQQEYSITAFGKNLTLDWLTPVSMPLFTGVELMKMIDEDGQLTFNEALDAVQRLADPVMNLSVLQGINQSMSQYESGLGKMVLSAGESYIGQFIPTLAGQIARSIDPTRRTTYAAKEGEGLGGDLEKFRNRLENKIPFVASMNSAYVDMWGRKDVDTDPFLLRVIKNSALPMYIKDQNKTEADDYISALFSQTGDHSVIPNSPESSYTFDGNKVYLMSDEYQATKEMVGQISNVGVTSLMGVSGIENLSAEEQANLVGKVYSFARAMAKANYANTKGISDYDPDGTNTRIYNAVNAGMTIGEAIYVNYIAGQFTADKNEKGNPISGSKKAKMLNFYNSMGLTEEQIKAIIPSSYTYP